MPSLTGIKIVEDINEATKFSIGFDNPKMKAWGWTTCAKQNGLDLMFLPKPLNAEDIFLLLN